MEAQEIKVGDVVRLKSEAINPTYMTVVEISDQKAKCFWKENQDFKSYDIPLPALCLKGNENKIKSDFL